MGCRIQELDNLSSLHSLKTLHLAQNKLASVDSVRHLSECKSIACLDLSNNKLEDPSILEVIGSSL